MPLLSVPATQALANVRSDRACLWPDGRRDRVRLSGIATVAFQPSFSLVPGEMVFTAGSCFARNIEQRFDELGFVVPAIALALPPEERASETENDFLNKYPVHSILNEMRWALDPGENYPERGLLNLKSGLWHDPHSAPNLAPAPLERVHERRRMVTGLYEQLPRCRVIVITLGLVEAWLDLQTGHYLNGPPPPAILRTDPDRFRLDVLTVDDVLRALEEMHGILERFGHPDFRILLTVSPVPLKSTFTGKDAIWANTYSKSTLRVAAEMFSISHERVDYFPSYEIVTHTIRTSAYIQDNRHIAPQTVDVIVDRVVEAYCGGAEKVEDEPTRPRKAAAEIQAALKKGDFDRASKLYADLEVKDKYERAGYSEGQYRYDFGRVLMRTGRIPEAQVHLARAIALDPTHAHAHYHLARALARLQRPLEAEDSFHAAVEIAPDIAEFRTSYANQLMELGKYDEAEHQLLTVLHSNPGEPRAEAALANVRARAKAGLAAQAPGLGPRAAVAAP